MLDMMAIAAFVVFVSDSVINHAWSDQRPDPQVIILSAACKGASTLNLAGEVSWAITDAVAEASRQGFKEAKGRELSFSPDLREDITGSTRFVFRVTMTYEQSSSLHHALFGSAPKWAMETAIVNDSNIHNRCSGAISRDDSSIEQMRTGSRQQWVKF